MYRSPLLFHQRESGKVLVCVVPVLVTLLALVVLPVVDVRLVMDTVELLGSPFLRLIYMIYDIY